MVTGVHAGSLCGTPARLHTKEEGGERHRGGFWRIFQPHAAEDRGLGTFEQQVPTEDNPGLMSQRAASCVTSYVCMSHPLHPDAQSASSGGKAAAQI